TFFYLNVSAPFNTNELKWINLSSNNEAVPPHHFAAAVKGGASNDTLFLYGGTSLNNETMSLVYTFDTKSNKWSVPKTTGIPTSGKLGISPIVDYNGLMYLYGGAPSIYGSKTNDTIILNTTNLSWKLANSINSPSSRAAYGAVLLP